MCQYVKTKCAQKFQPIWIKDISLLELGGRGHFWRHIELWKVLRELALNTSLKCSFLSLIWAEELNYRQYLGADITNCRKYGLFTTHFPLKLQSSVGTSNFCPNWQKFQHRFQHRCFFTYWHISRGCPERN